MSEIEKAADLQAELNLLRTRRYEEVKRVAEELPARITEVVDRARGLPRWRWLKRRRLMVRAGQMALSLRYFRRAHGRDL